MLELDALKGLEGLQADAVGGVGAVSYTHLDVYKRQGPGQTDVETRRDVLPGPERHLADRLAGAGAGQLHPDPDQMCIRDSQCTTA